MNPQNTDAAFAARNGSYAGTPNSTPDTSNGAVQSGASTSPYYQPASINASTIGTQPLTVPNNPTVSPAMGIIGSTNALTIDALGQATNTINGLDQNLNTLTQNKTDVTSRISSLLGTEVNAEKQLPDIQAQLGLPQQQKDLFGINTEIANQQVAYRQAQDAIKARGDISQEAQQGLLGNQQDIYGRRLADLAIRQAAANTNVAAITSAAQNRVDLITAPIKTEINGLQNFVMSNLDNLTKDEQTKIGQIISEKNNLLTRTTATQTAISGLITDAMKAGTKIPDAVVAQVLGAPDALTAASILAKNGIDLQTNKFVPSTDAFGNPIAFNAKTGAFGSVTPGSTASVSNPTGTGSGQAKLPIEQYGLLANTDLNPSNGKDMLAQRYIDLYIKNGRVPSAYEIGRNLQPQALASLASRANDLYYQATGSGLPNPEIIKSNQALVANNNKLANNLKLQEQTVSANVDLSLANMKKNDLNSTGFKPLDSMLNTINDMFQDPNVGQLLAQNSTIQNELGSLLAVKNASGTTVYDKLQSAGIITSSDSEAQIKAKVGSLLKEAANFATSINSANADLYKQIDPLLQDPNNPLRQSMLSVKNTGNPASGEVNKTNTKIEGLNVTIGSQTYTMPSLDAVNQFKKDHNLQ